MTAVFSRTLERHAFGWLVAANAVGVWLAALLLWPALGGLAGPFGYGRWMPLHLNWQLYGWCALPLAGALAAWLVTPDAAGRWHLRLALGAWSAALALGGVSWLAGVTSGKLFLDWHGWARPLLPLAMLVLWSVLALHAWLRRGEHGPMGRAIRGGLLLVLLAVPSLLFWAEGREVYPAVNPHSGGATGASLLGSTLAILVVFGALPAFLRVPGRAAWWYWAALAVGAGVFMAADHGDASHHATGQIVALAALLPWLGLLPAYLRGFAWHASARPWLHASFVWWAVLVVTGFLTFLPGWSERLKFTNALVAHAHLAMAGLVTSLNLTILRQLRGGGSCRGFWLWQSGCAVHVAVLAVLGWREAEDPAALFLGDGFSQAAYALRLGAGGAMLLASVQWWKESGA
ncbi:MAG: hypothetical protein KF897_04530 [Opitutaceae bacterium]|nr:hypothetical protein [Opitutaceae bacterium]